MFVTWRKNTSVITLHLLKSRRICPHSHKLSWHLLFYFLSSNIIKHHLIPKNTIVTERCAVIISQHQFFRKDILPQLKWNVDQERLDCFSKFYLPLLLILRNLIWKVPKIEYLLTSSHDISYFSSTVRREIHLALSVSFHLLDIVWSLYLLLSPNGWYLHLSAVNFKCRPNRKKFN